MRTHGFFRGKRVLVTGGASFIGSHLTELLVALGSQVTVVDDLSSGRVENLAAVEGDIGFRKADLRDPDEARRASSGQEIVFHLAASHGGRGYIDTHPVDCAGNMLLDHVVFRAAAAEGVSRIVLASSACVYPVNLQASSEERGLLREEDAGFDRPGSAFADGEYGWAKLMGELQLRAFHKQYGLTGVACRLFTAYGERENESHAVVALIAKALARLDPFPVWGDGSQTRNFTYVADTVAGMALAAAHIDGFGVVNVGGSRHHTILELLEVIFRETGFRPARIDRQTDRPVGVRSRASDNTRARRLLDWEPEVGLDEGVRRTVAWYRQVFDEARAQRLDALLMERDR